MDLAETELRFPELAGQPAPPAARLNPARLVAAYHALQPDPAEPTQRVAFGTSGHRGSAYDAAFNEHHVLAITQAICTQRRAAGIDGPLFLGIDTHALSEPAAITAIEVLAAHGVELRLSAGHEYTPTPAVSQAILEHNRGRRRGLADGIVITPSHNPPRDGGFKYNPPHGGPAGQEITGPIEHAANRLLEAGAAGLAGIPRMPYARALQAVTTRPHDFLRAYVDGLASVLDLDAIRGAGVRIGVDPLGGAGVHYWAAIAERYQLDLTVLSETIDPSFGFMTLDRDGRIRMDPSSGCAMQRLLAQRGRFDVALACDTDHDRHGIVTPAAGLLSPNAYLPVAIDYLFRHRPQWLQLPTRAGIGKTAVSTLLIDRVAARLGRPLLEVPVGFKWFTEGLQQGTLGFVGEESAGATFLRRDGSVWTTDKDGIAAALLAAEITARCGRDPGELHDALTGALGRPVSERIDAPATPALRRTLAALTPTQLDLRELAGEPITAVLDRAPGNQAALGGIKVASASGWFAARPSGTEDIVRVYAESLRGPEHLQRIVQEAQALLARLDGV